MINATFNEIASRIQSLRLNEENHVLIITFVDDSTAKLANLSLLISFGKKMGEENEKYFSFKELGLPSPPSKLHLKVPSEITIKKGNRVRLSYVNGDDAETNSLCFKII